MQTSLSSRDRSCALKTDALERGIYAASSDDLPARPRKIPARKLVRAVKRHKCRAPAACALAIGLFLVAVITGCNKAGTTVLGQTPMGPSQTIMGARGVQGSAPVVVEGVLIEKCPVAGCWFRLRDTSGVIKVDTKAAGFVVTSVPLQTKLMVAGKITREGDEPALEATGLRY